MGIFNPPSSGGGGGGGVTSVNTRTGAVTLAASDILSGTFDIARIPVVPSQKQVVSSGTIAQLTTAQQAEIGQGTIVTTTDGRRWVYTGIGSKVLEASYITLADVSPDWNAIDNKPTSFTPSGHASSHASGGLDAITPASIGASASPQIDIFKVTGGVNSFTWNKPANAKLFAFECVGGGGGGGKGLAVVAGTAVSGGGGGGSGGYSRALISAADLPNTDAYSVVVGIGGAGGTTGNATAGTPSNVSGSTLGIFVNANGGGLGAAGVATTASTGGTGGAPAGNNGGSGNITTAGANGSGQGYAPSSGGAGGGCSTTTPFNGGTSGAAQFISGGTGVGGIASTTGNGGNGAVVTPRAIPSLVINGSGGGGGGASTFAGASGGAGANASGVGCGGGGGGSVSAGGPTASGTGGNGGKGSDGIVVITSYF
jgi:hypothetical protein